MNYKAHRSISGKAGDVVVLIERVENIQQAESWDGSRYNNMQLHDQIMDYERTIEILRSFGLQ